MEKFQWWITKRSTAKELVGGSKLEKPVVRAAENQLVESSQHTTFAN
jgi:hypothetical protein